MFIVLLLITLALAGGGIAILYYTYGKKKVAPRVPPLILREPGIAVNEAESRGVVTRFSRPPTYSPRTVGSYGSRSYVANDTTPQPDDGVSAAVATAALSSALNAQSSDPAPDVFSGGGGSGGGGGASADWGSTDSSSSSSSFDSGSSSVDSGVGTSGSVDS